ncbi:clasp N terminal-domain-containing protein [Microdochium trichocladiopsis]|uniref:Clasp N terminal-domain-containing protein n=1 Tax=Microdochium trichocladiopsis TaxID=1682393 RepID=A0A9P9BQR0_9PEZI|nr:clasp N terminal-domain-containing protein [Microdochium trichocladiopsis]KAH7031115.1 clasp N terminal-domain-containing protein [Microdochium trichocladiopsis]
MAEKLSDEQVANLLVLLRKDVSVEAKVQQVTATKSAIKQHNVPDSCIPQLFEALRLASSSQHSAIVTAGFAALNHLLTRLSRQDPKFIVREAKQTLPLIVDKMGDQKDKFRTLAIQAMATYYTQSPADAERSVRNIALVGKNPRAKESGMQWLLQMHKEHGLQFRAYVPTLMDLLEDADGMVRDVAKQTVIELFKDAPNAAKSDLKKQLKNFKVRPAIESAIVKELNPVGAVKRDLGEARPASAASTRPNLGASVSSMSSERPTTPAPPPEATAEAVEPSYVNTQRELDEIFKDMHYWFEGKESEQNWLKREESVRKLRKLTAGNGPSDFPDAFVAGARALLDGIIKAVISLRTSLSKEGCSLVQDLANTFGPAIDPMVELLMQTFIKLCAATKKIASQQANMTVDTIIGKCTYTPRIMQHIWAACQDKNVQPRTYAAGWLQTLMKKEAHHKSHIEHGGGLDLIEKCLKKGLADSNPGVRERCRATYWQFAGIWPAKAEAIMESLDAVAQKLLRNDPHNPNSPKKAEAAAPARPGLGLSKSTMGGTKPSLREAMMAQKRQLAAKNLPARPGSAMATITPARPATTTTSTTHSAAPATRPRPEASTLSTGGMSHAPMRPARRRPEMAARPATAGPYSVRSHDAASTERTSPSDAAKKPVLSKPISGSPKRTAPRARPGHQATASESNVATITTPSRPPTAPKAVAPPSRISPSKSQTVANAIVYTSPSKSSEDFTLVVPEVASLKQSARPSSPSPNTTPVGTPRSTPVAEPVLSTPSKTPLKVFEDPFTAEAKETPRPTSSPEVVQRPVLEDKPVNEDAAVPGRMSKDVGEQALSPASEVSPEKARQYARLLESGITRVKAQTLDVHGFRKLQSVIRDNKSLFSDETFDALLVGLFEYLESPLADLAPEKIQDVKAQILATVKLMLKKTPNNFQPHISRGLEALLAARACYDARTHIVSGLELLADELVVLGDADEIVVTMTKKLSSMDATDTSGSRSMSMGLHILRQLIETKTTFVPTEAEIESLAALSSTCLESKESGVRMDAVQLCVALHARVGETKFWSCMKNVKDDPKSLITYYVVKRQRENQAARA